MPTLKLVVFDFDEVVNPTEKPWCRTWQRFIRRHGGEMPTREWMDEMERTDDNPVQIVYDRTGHYVTEGEHSAAVAQTLPFLSPANVDPHALRLMRELKATGVNVAVVSNASVDWLGRFLPHDQRRHIDHVRACALREHLKPSPFMLVETMDRFGVRPEESVGIDDSRRGCAGVLASGMHCVHRTTDLTRHLDMPGTWRVDGLAKVTAPSLAAQFGLTTPRPVLAL